MAALTDEILMAYADGALDAQAAARVEALLKGDAEARARVSMFRATGRELGALYEGVVHEPVPAHLTRFVMGYGRSSAEGPMPQSPSLAALPSGRGFAPSRRPRLGGRWAALKARLIPEGAGWHLAAASAAALTVGVSAGFLLSGPGQDGGLGPGLTVMRQGQILASGALHHVLESLPSNEERAAASTNGAAAVRAVLSFKTKAGGYCREYEMAAPQGRFQGLACRQADGHWAVEAHVAEEAVAAGTHVVAHGELLDKIAESRMEGDALGASEEKAALRRGWK